jgi:hypothetical protein
MKDVLEKFGLLELFAYLCPGALLLGSVFFLWVKLPADPEGGLAKEGWLSFSLSAFLVILAYILGLILATISSEGAAFYLRYPLPSWCGWWWLLFCWPFWFWLLFWFPKLREDENETISLAQTAILEDLPPRTQLAGLSRLLRTPWSWLSFYRTIVAHEVGEKGKVILEEAEIVHRRLSFAMGVSLTLLVIALQSMVRLLLMGVEYRVGGTYNFPEVGLITLLLLTVGELLTSFALRFVAGRWWETVFALTTTLYKLAHRPERTPEPTRHYVVLQVLEPGHPTTGGGTRI